MTNFEFQEGTKEHTISLELPATLRQQFANAPREFRYSGALPKDWKRDYFQIFLQHSADQPIVRNLLLALKRQDNAQSSDSLASTTIAFVQTAIAYDWQTAYKVAGGHIRYPSETLLDRKGVCADKTILLAALLQGLGYGVAIFTWERANHMALGLLVPAGFGNFGTPYAMVETTAPTAMGQIPDRYAGGIKLDGTPEVVILPGRNGVFQGIVAQRKQEAEDERQYGRDYLKLGPKQQSIFREMHPLKSEIERLAQQLKGCQGNLPPARFAECQALNASHNEKVKRYNVLVAQFNAAANKNGN